MFRRVVTAGAAAAVIVGAGTTALAVSGEPQTTSGNAAHSAQTSAGNGTQTDSKTGKKTGKDRRGSLRSALRRTAHAEVVTKSKDGFVEHDAVRGQVTSLTATSISVKAADGYAKTFTVGDKTHVRKRPASGGKGKGTPAKISDVKAGDQVAVLGRVDASSSANPTATVVIDGLKK